MALNNRHVYFKLNSDDILSIVKDRLAKDVKFKDGHSAVLNFLGDEKNLRIVAVFSDVDDDLEQIDLNEIDKEIDFNGDLSTMSDAGNIRNLTDEEREKIIKKLSRRNYIQKLNNFFQKK
ncbi:hypothetical protein CW357_17450 [Rummeliibacillus sp. TYF005]|uniref:hypothetical protein n=1 Tax=unclassified Rummeliibacillus TaxID=2622809 RepID=UPI000E66527A|nr:MULTISPECIES: hypothetical protein [unclassified Rummeliibacillus]RIJ62891.1 hypothetical protein D1606_17805 [Rummeliibacillus sp. POC4]RPJ94050.1 hypothetical protein CW357_17450 [Rummeliibacillus sp. TYF005]